MSRLSPALQSFRVGGIHLHDDLLTLSRANVDRVLLIFDMVSSGEV